MAYRRWPLGWGRRVRGGHSVGTFQSLVGPCGSSGTGICGDSGSSSSWGDAEWIVS